MVNQRLPDIGGDGGKLVVQLLGEVEQSIVISVIKLTTGIVIQKLLFGVSQRAIGCELIGGLG